MSYLIYYYHHHSWIPKYWQQQGAKSEPGSEAAGGGGTSHSPSCYKWSGAATPTQPAQSDNGRGGGVADILSPFQSYDQHHQVTGEYSGQNVMPSFWFEQKIR